jgi:hypothetical protein
MSKRSLYILAIGITIALGLASRRYSAPDSWVHIYLGDVLWTTLFYWCFRFVFLRKTLIFSLMIAIVWSFAIEFSQLYHTNWIDTIRQTTLGGLLLGFGFLWSDLVAYVVGAFVGFGLDTYFVAKTTPSVYH